MPLTLVAPALLPTGTKQEGIDTEGAFDVGSERAEASPLMLPSLRRARHGNRLNLCRQRLWHSITRKESSRP